MAPFGSLVALSVTSENDMTPSPEISLISAHERSHMHSEIQPYESAEDDEVSDEEDEESSVFVRVWSCPGELMVPVEANTTSLLGQRAVRTLCVAGGHVSWGLLHGAYSTSLCCLDSSSHTTCRPSDHICILVRYGISSFALQGLNTAGTAPPHLQELGHEYASSVYPAPTELNISGISPAQGNQKVPSSAPAAAPSPLEIDSPSRQHKGHTWPCGSLRNCVLLSVLTLITAGAWTFAGLCIHNIGSSDALDIEWEQRICTVCSTC